VKYDFKLMDNNFFLCCISVFAIACISLACSLLEMLACLLECSCSFVGSIEPRGSVEDRLGYAMISYALDMLCYSMAMLRNYVVCNSDTKISL